MGASSGAGKEGWQVGAWGREAGHGRGRGDWGGPDHPPVTLLAAFCVPGAEQHDDDEEDQQNYHAACNHAQEDLGRRGGREGGGTGEEGRRRAEVINVAAMLPRKLFLSLNNILRFCGTN